MKRNADDKTKLSHLGRSPHDYHGAVNPPVYHTSTVLRKTAAEFMDSRRHRFDKGHLFYGRMGTPTHFALEEAVAEIEGGYGALLVPSGLAAIAVAILSQAQAGDHILVADTVYTPNRSFCDGFLARMGVETTYYDPMLGADIAELFRDNTKLVFVESPGSVTFEVQDIPAIAGAARQAGIAVVMDNSWATPLHFKSIAQGVDISIHAATKFIVGHSDAMLGIVIAADEALYRRIRETDGALGMAVGPDDAFLGLRGLRSLAVRVQRHYENGLALASWLAEHPLVERVMYPPLPGDPGHDLWKRDFTGGCGLFGVVLREAPGKAGFGALMDELDYFGIGASWGGYESLIMPTKPEASRTATEWNAPGRTFRIHCGLEDAQDLIGDLEAGLDRLATHLKKTGG
ncbi:MAG: cystathionine beta-lyase [Rhodovibrionaceae bacterium]